MLRRLVSFCHGRDLSPLISLAILALIILGWWGSGYIRHPHLRVVTHRVLDSWHMLGYPYYSGFPRIECRQWTNPDKQAGRNGPNFRSNSDRFCWLDERGRISSSWYQFPGEVKLTLSPHGKYAEAIISESRISLARQYSAPQPFPNLKVPPDRLFVNTAILTDAGDIASSDGGGFNTLAGKRVPIPEGWQLGPFTAITNATRFCLLQRYDTVSHTFIMGLYDLPAHRMQWTYPLSGQYHNLSIVGRDDAVFISGKRSIYISGNGAAIFDNQKLLATYNAETHSTKPTVTSKTHHAWAYGEDGSVWTEDGRQLYCLLWREGDARVRTIRLENTVHAEGTDTLAVWGDGWYVAHSFSVLPPGGFPLEWEKSPGRRVALIPNYRRKLVLYQNGKPVDHYEIPTYIDGLSGSLSWDDYRDHLAFSSDGRYLSWNPGLDMERHDFYVFGVR